MKVVGSWLISTVLTVEAVRGWGYVGTTELVVKETKREMLYELTTVIHMETRKLRLLNRLFKQRERT